MRYKPEISRYKLHIRHKIVPKPLSIKKKTKWQVLKLPPGYIDSQAETKIFFSAISRCKSTPVSTYMSKY